MTDDELVAALRDPTEAAIIAGRHRTISLQIKILSDDTRDGAPERIRMETQRALALWLGPENVYVELDPIAALAEQMLAPDAGRPWGPA